MATEGKRLVVMHRWDEKFFRNTRGQIVTLLRHGGHPVDELARELGLTNNGVRAHLALLERDGIVRQGNTVRRGSGGGKPAYVYELTPDAEELFPKAYEPVLRHLLSVLSQRVGPEQSEALLREVGGLMAGKFEAPANGLRVRLEAAVAVLNQMGGEAEIEERDGTCFIRSYGCPLSGIVPDHPELCSLVESLVAELAGVPVREHCDRGEKPRCCFQVMPSGDSELATHS